jgi:hypothetical protein
MENVEWLSGWGPGSAGILVAAFACVPETIAQKTCFRSNGQ